MGILRRLREWREDKDGTLIGPNIDADSVDAGSVNTDRLSVGEYVTSIRLDNSQTISEDTETTIDFDSRVREDSSIAAANLSSNEINIQQDGDYVVFARGSLNSPGTGISFFVTPVINGSNIGGNFQHGANNGRNLVSITPTRVIQLSDGDTVSAIVFQDSGGDGSRELEGTASSFKTGLEVRRIG